MFFLEIALVGLLLSGASAGAEEAANVFVWLWRLRRLVACAGGAILLRSALWHTASFASFASFSRTRLPTPVPIALLTHVTTHTSVASSDTPPRIYYVVYISPTSTCMCVFARRALISSHMSASLTPPFCVWPPISPYIYLSTGMCVLFAGRRTEGA